MSSEEEAPEREDDPRPIPDQVDPRPVWTPPERSDQAPGEEVVQVNDAYTGGGPPPDDETRKDDEQHPTGG
jgi:hypothetical protein